MPYRQTHYHSLNCPPHPSIHLLGGCGGPDSLSRSLSLSVAHSTSSLSSPLFLVPSVSLLPQSFIFTASLFIQFLILPSPFPLSLSRAAGKLALGHEQVTYNHVLEIYGCVRVCVCMHVCVQL